MGASILIVDDNAMNLKLEKIVLLAQGYDVHTAASAEEALLILETIQVQLILLDLQLPGMSGLDFARRLRSNTEFDGIIILAVTAYSTKGVKENALAIGVDGYITKPINIEAFPKIIADFLSGKTDIDTNHSY